MATSERMGDGGPAFPTQGGDDYHPLPGMTLRDYMAAKAMAAMIGTAGAPALGGLEGMEACTAAAAYRIANAMLAARSQP